MSYEIRIDQFEGPLDLLLYLVQKEEVDARRISMTSICNQFVEFLQTMDVDQLPAAGEFMEMAARLMALKAAELLPREVDNAEESFEFDLDREEILRQILVYSKFKEVASGLKSKEDENFGCVSRGRSESIREEVDEDSDEPEAGVFELYQSFLITLRRRVREAVHTIEVDHVTIEDRQQAIENFLIFQGRAAFSELMGGIPDRTLAAVTFMALLEMVKLDQIVIRQPIFGKEMVVFRKKDNGDFLGEISRDVFELSDQGQLKQGLAEFARQKAKSLKKEEDLDDMLRSLTQKALEGKMVTEEEIADRLSGSAGALSWAEYWQERYLEEGFRRLAEIQHLRPWQKVGVEKSAFKAKSLFANRAIPRSHIQAKLGLHSHSLRHH